MSKRLITLLVSVMSSGVLLAADANQMKYVEILPATALTNTQTKTGSAVDVSSYKGNATVVVLAGVPITSKGNYSNAITIQHSITGTNNWSTLTNTAGTAGVITHTGNSSSGADTFSIDMARVRKYMRAVSVATNDGGSVSVLLVAPMKSE
jgi:hypothetical protein